MAESPKKSKYRTHDSPRLPIPKVDWGPSKTDPSQDIPITKLIAQFVRRGEPAPVLPYGEDLRGVDLIDAHRIVQNYRNLAAADKKTADEKAKAEKAAALEKRNQRVRELVSKAHEYKPGSSELQAIAQELTGLLPGLEGEPPPK